MAVMASNGPSTPFPFLAPWPSHPPAIETPPRLVLAWPLISWPKNASCSWIPPQASCASLPPRWWATTRCRLSFRPCTAPLSCSLQPLLKLLLLSLRPSLLPICLTRFTFAESWKSDFWTCVCVFTFISSAFASVRDELQLQVPVCNLVVITNAIPLLLLPLYSFLAVSEMLNYSDTCAVPSVCNPLHPILFIPETDMLFSCWNSQSFHFHMGGVSRFTTQAMTWTDFVLLHKPWHEQI